MRKILILAFAIVAVLGIAGSASAKTRDRNHDRLPDRWERAHHLSLKVKQGKRDQDHDGLNNRGEFRSHTDPRDDDSDNDGIEDGDENSGTIKSFKDGVLTIRLDKGGELSGTVDAGTEIECHSAAAHDSSAGDDEDPGSDDDTPGTDDDDPGEDDDDQGEDDHCATDALTTGTRVTEAELEGSRFDELELATA